MSALDELTHKLADPIYDAGGELTVLTAKRKPGSARARVMFGEPVDAIHQQDGSVVMRQNNAAFIKHIADTYGISENAAMELSGSDFVSLRDKFAPFFH